MGFAFFSMWRIRNLIYLFILCRPQGIEIQHGKNKSALVVLCELKTGQMPNPEPLKFGFCSYIFYKSKVNMFSKVP